MTMPRTQRPKLHLPRPGVPEEREPPGLPVEPDVPGVPDEGNEPDAPEIPDMPDDLEDGHVPTHIPEDPEHDRVVDPGGNPAPVR
jgi:hypothetical protein